VVLRESLKLKMHFTLELLLERTYIPESAKEDAIHLGLEFLLIDVVKVRHEEF
jgi:hypothetical protein